MRDTGRAYFVSGTDTEIGKTLIASALLHLLGRAGFAAAGMKPVAAGAQWCGGRWHNEDADALAANSGVALPQALSTPYLLRQPTAPHIAATLEQRCISLPHILECYEQIAAMAQAVVVEGVGGFRVPLDGVVDTSDMAKALGLPVVLVVGLRLGCISHALLTVEAIAARGLRLAGWVVNTVDAGMLNSPATVQAMAERVDAPLLGWVPRLSPPMADPAQMAAAAAAHLDMSRLAGWPA